MMAGRRWVVAVLAGLYFLLLAAPVVLLIREGEVQRDFSVYLSGEDRLTLYRAEVEHVTLLNVLHRASMNEPGVGRDAVRTGIDLLTAAARS